MREQRSQCGRHAGSPFHAAFARPAVLLTPPTAAAIHQAELHSSKSAPAELALAGYREVLWLRLWRPSTWAHLWPIFRPAWLRPRRQGVTQQRRRRLAIITPLHTATAGRLAPAADRTQEEGFKASSAFSTPASQTAACCSACYCLAPAVTPFSPRRPVLSCQMPQFAPWPPNSSFGALTFQRLYYLFPKGLALKPSAAPMPPPPPPPLPVSARPPPGLRPSNKQWLDPCDKLSAGKAAR